MKRIPILSACALLLLVTPVMADKPDVKKPADRQPRIEVDQETREILDKINSVGPYDLPDLELKRDANYAATSQDLEPFGRIKPFKEHFLLQLEYTGPGRAIPEPEHVETVKVLHNLKCWRCAANPLTASCRWPWFANSASAAA